MLILLRYAGELSTKARKTRIAFTSRLIANIAVALASQRIPHEVRRQWSRLFVETPDPRALEILSRVFGIRSLSVVQQHKVRDISHLVDVGEEIFSSEVSGKTFAVRSRRVGGMKDARFSSMDVQKALGARLLPYALKVDLGRPGITAHVELHGDEAYFFTEITAGVGGLPLGTRERGLALISGGFDSAVAAWLMLKRGVALDYLFVNLAGDAHLMTMLPVVKKLSDDWSYGDRPRLFVVDFLPVVQEMQRWAEPRYWQVILKRLMVRAAGEVASKLGSLALVTGEAIGQVSSQTLPNLRVISEVASLPILRPLIGFDKHEIIDYARRIGTAHLSERVEEHCALVRRNPATSASLHRVLNQEESIDFSVLERVVNERAAFDLPAINLDEILIKAREIDEIPAGAQVLDLRSSFSFGAWHVPGAIHLDFFEALDDIESLELDPNRPVVAYCEVGIKSAQVAEKLSKAGYTAYHFAGGMRKLMEYAIEQNLLPAELLPSSAFLD